MSYYSEEITCPVCGGENCTKSVDTKDGYEQIECLDCGSNIVKGQLLEFRTLKEVNELRFRLFPWLK